MLQVITPATNINLTTLDAVKLDIPNPRVSDEWLTAAIKEQSARCASWCSRVFAEQTYKETLWLPRPEEELILRGWPVGQVVSLMESGWTVEPAGYMAETGTGCVVRIQNGVRSKFYGTVEITYKAGFKLPGEEGENLPFDIQRACKELVKGALYAKTRDPQLKALTLPGISEEQYIVGNPGSGTLPPEIEGMLGPYRNINSMRQ